MNFYSYIYIYILEQFFINERMKLKYKGSVFDETSEEKINTDK